MKRLLCLLNYLAIFPVLMASCSAERPSKTFVNSTTTAAQKPVAAANPITVDSDSVPTSKESTSGGIGELPQVAETPPQIEMPTPAKQVTPSDVTAPIIESVTLTKPSCGILRAEIVAMDNQALASKAYSFDAGVSWQEGNTKDYLESNVIVPSNAIQVKDAAGNVEIHKQQHAETNAQCPNYAWQASDWGSCSVSCGSGTKLRTVSCKDSSGGVAADSSCIGIKPGLSESCDAGVCVPKVTCTQTVITVSTYQAGVTCTDTLPTSTVDENSIVWSNRVNGTRNLGAGCLIHPGQNLETPYLGTVSGGMYGVCTNYCAVKATCTSHGWTDYGFTW